MRLFIGFHTHVLQDEDQQKKATEILSQHKVGGHPLKIALGNKRKSGISNQETDQARKKQKQETNSLPQTIQDVVTPFWK